MGIDVSIKSLQARDVWNISHKLVRIFSDYCTVRYYLVLAKYQIVLPDGEKSCVAGIPPEYVSVVDNLTEEVPSTVWEYLYEHFGGGPVVNHLHVCAICKKEKEDLETKRNKEREVFQKVCVNV